MNFCILIASPRLNGNPATLCKPFINELQANNASVTYITLADKYILPCKGCYVCQNIGDSYGCVQKDNILSVIEHIIDADCLVHATPIYTWYYTAPHESPSRPPLWSQQVLWLRDRQACGRAKK